ncbi:hypothetical protein GOP47_0016238 [Adiantum capillus-veneris]|uniref:SHSP domain-containing protein n=1 Tax=Adiantum capillus-veneris TaxID=13818 RepID=A0A9D4UI81_ADICA|nr:hypothetical protein GOP47_0016238 [Adiantum capillus-veneris]
MATTAPVDVKELSGSFIFVVDVPGLRNTDVKVQIENDTILKISGERKRDLDGQDMDIKYVRVERPAGKFMRKFNLPSHVNLDSISAACQDGILTIVVPKVPTPEPHRPRTFDVQVGSVLLGNT